MQTKKQFEIETINQSINIFSNENKYEWNVAFKKKFVTRIKIKRIISTIIKLIIIVLIVINLILWVDTKT